ncbi:MAG TPA: cytochrome P450, partial [Thermoanaerobaculia bacterium]|nr:cytochrome P450 [Thermoanaerobaculia bacterium]
MTTSLPPGPRGVLRGGAMLSFPRRPEAFRRVAARYGDIASWVVGRQRFVLINHPDLIREAFITREEQFVKGWGPVLGNSVLGAGLITSEGALHHRQRRLVLPAMHRGRLEEYASSAIRHGMAMRDAWPSRASVSLLDEYRGVTRRVIGETVLGGDL